MKELPINQIICGDCIEVLRTLPENSVHCCVTSPPYWGLRDYGVEGQIGLEPTPEEYVAKMVEVFREVRRVLRDDGTCWVNLGDSYTRSPKKGGSGPNGKHDYVPSYGDARRYMSESLGSSDGFVGRGDRAAVRNGAEGLKEKDLVGIPWSVAKALQQPYYTGRIKRAEDRIWLAAMLEAEGCMFIHKRKAGQSNGQGYERQSDTYSPGIEIANTHESIVRRCMEIAGAGSICSQGPEQNGHRRQTIFRWNLRTTESRSLVRELYPHLVAKRQQARILCACPTSGMEAEAGHAALKILHRGGQTSVDFGEPETMYEPGWYLRQDCIWSKPNPMPESVTDRCCKSHEYLFLLAKSARYFFDSEAIKEPSVTGDTRKPYGSDGAWAMDGRNKWDEGKGQPRDNADGATRTKRSVWTVPTAPFKEAHFATFPPELIRPCIKAGTSQKGCCPKCGKPWVRKIEKIRRPTRPGENTKVKVPGGWDIGEGSHGTIHRTGRTEATYRDTAEVGNRDPQRHVTESQTVGWEPSCDCAAGDPVPCIVLDPFGGSGTTGYVAAQEGRDYILIELNPQYVKMAEATRLREVETGVPVKEAKTGQMALFTS